MSTKRDEAVARVREHLDRIARLADEDNWRDVTLESVEQDTYDAMAWSPIDCACGPDGESSDPLFNAPWKLVAESLAALRALVEPSTPPDAELGERAERMAGEITHYWREWQDSNAYPDPLQAYLRAALKSVRAKAQNE